MDSSKLTNSTPLHLKNLGYAVFSKPELLLQKNPGQVTAYTQTVLRILNKQVFAVGQFDEKRAYSNRLAEQLKHGQAFYCSFNFEFELAPEFCSLNGDISVQTSGAFFVSV